MNDVHITNQIGKQCPSLTRSEEQQIDHNQPGPDRDPNGTILPLLMRPAGYYITISTRQSLQPTIPRRLTDLMVICPVVPGQLHWRELTDLMVNHLVVPR